jgi:glutamine amidotransferase
MAGLHEKGLVQPIQEFALSGKPLLGICLGMQMLMEESEEFGFHEGLGLIPGRVIGIPQIAYQGNAKGKIPHIGWNQLQEVNSWNDSIMRDINPGDSTYFVHSYMAVTTNEEHLLASITYNGHRIAATIRKDNIYGCQFHPEKSGQIGLTIIRNFGS